jgi:GNAT superfamily N-acetyltransferase
MDDIKYRQTFPLDVIMDSNPSELEFLPVDKSRWPDFEELFESKGGPKNCWCMVWRSTGKELKHTDKSHRKTYIRKRVNEHIPIGLMAYSSNKPIAWCSIAPRETHKQLGGNDSLKNVWSLVCFYIKKEFRQQGLTEKLIREAIKYAKKNGAKYIEAYPVDPDSPSYRFMGFKQTFENMGFDFVHKAGKRRNVMILKL